MKLKIYSLLGALITTPILAFANVKTDSSQNSKLLSNHHNIHQNLVEKDLIHLHSEGAISTKDAEILINNLSKESTKRIVSSPNSDDKNIKVSKFENKKKVNIQLFESETLVKLNMLNVTKDIKSEIIESNSGWQIILQFPEEKEIDLSHIKKSSDNILDFEVSKFNDRTYLLKITSLYLLD